MVIAAVQHETYGSECYQLRVCICVCVLSLLAGFCGYNSFLADIFLDDPTFEKSVMSSIRTLIHYVQHQITSSGEKSLTHLPVQLIPGPGQLILEPAPSHDGSSIHLASKLDVCSHICVAVHTSSILPLWRLSCPDLTLPCRHMEEQWCPGIIQTTSYQSQCCSSLPAVKHNTLSLDSHGLNIRPSVWLYSSDMSVLWFILLLLLPFREKQTLTGRAACFNCSYIVVRLPCPFQLTDCSILTDKEW